MIVEMSFTRSDFPETLNAMRLWLEQRNTPIKWFRTAMNRESGSVTVRTEFEDEGTALAFRGAFAPTPTITYQDY